MEQQPSQKQLKLPLDSSSKPPANDPEPPRENYCQVFRIVPKAEKHEATLIAELYENILDTVRHIE
jgi:hypothetical protein